MYSTGRADDFVVNSPTVVQNGNGANVMNGGDSLTITNDGSITTGGAEGVLGTGNNNTINNDGSVVTTGNANHGISNVDNGAINNGGLISTDGNNSNGIFVNDGNTIGITGSGSIVTDGNNSDGVFANDGNTINITGSGSIATDANNSDGIFANDGNTITNDGSISTIFNTSRGIAVSNNNNVSNSGSITTNFNNSRGIFGDDDNIISNSGSITTGGNNAEGIYVTDNNRITNCGTIITTGNNSGNIFANDTNTIINCGTISSTGTNSRGISTEDNNTIINNGAITTTGNNSEGILANDGNTITVGGSILTTGTNSPAISVDSNNTVNISGSVIATQSDAILFTGSNNTLNLSASASIIGGFSLGANTTLNIDTGSSGSILWMFDTTQLAGGVPAVLGSAPVFQSLNGGVLQIATLDPTALLSSSDGLAQLSGSLSGLVQQRLGGGDAGPSNLGNNTFVSTKGHNSRINDAHNAAEKSYVGYAAPKAWLSVFGVSSDYDSTNATLGYEIGIRGAAGGYDWSPSADLNFGFMFGYSEQGMEANGQFASSYDNETSGFFSGLFGRYQLGKAAFVDFSLMGGILDHSQNRSINESLAAGGASSAVGAFNSYWLSPEIGIGTKYQIADGWMVSPSLRLRYSSQWVDGYAETGASASNAIFGSRQVAIGEASAEIAVGKQTEKSSMTLRFGYLYGAAIGDDTVNVTMLGQTRMVSTRAQDRGAGYLGADTSFYLTEMLGLEFSGKATIGSDFTSLQGNIRLILKF